MADTDDTGSEVSRRGFLRGGAAVVGATWTAPMVVAAPTLMAAGGSPVPATTTTTRPGTQGTTTSTSPPGGGTTTTTSPPGGSTTTTAPGGTTTSTTEGPTVLPREETPNGPSGQPGPGGGLTEVAQQRPRARDRRGGSLATTGIELMQEVAVAGGAIAAGAGLSHAARKAKGRSGEAVDDDPDEPPAAPAP